MSEFPPLTPDEQYDLVVAHLSKQDKIDVDSSKFSLFYFSRCGHVKGVSYLISRGMPIDTDTGYGDTPLYIACKYGHVDLVKYLISEGANVNKDVDLGFTPLHTASELNRLAIVEILLSHGANINAKTDIGVSSLTLAYVYKNVEIVKILISEGADYSKLMKMYEGSPDEMILEQIIIEIGIDKVKMI